MFLPGLPSPSPEVIAALITRERPTPFEALADGLDLWECRFGVLPEVRAYVGSELLGVAPAVQGLAPDVASGQGVNSLDAAPQWQRVMLGVQEIPERWRALKARAFATDGNSQETWKVAMGLSTEIDRHIKHVFKAIGRHDMQVMREVLCGIVGQSLCRWAWVVGLLEKSNRPITARIVIEALVSEGRDDPAALLEALLVVRLMHGPNSMASYVMGRWLSEQVWGCRGLSGPVPSPSSPLMQELHWAWGQRGVILGLESFGSVAEREEAEAMQWDSARPNGIAIGVALLWERVDCYTFGEGESAIKAREVLSKPWVSDDDPWGEIKDGDAVGWRTALKVLGLRQQETRDQGGRLERVLLTAVDAELATSAALLVLRWRNHFVSSRLWREPEGFVAEVNHWLACVLLRWDGERQGVLAPKNSGIIQRHWMASSKGSEMEAPLLELSDLQKKDWRVTEVLRPLIYSALASTALGLKAGKATHLHDLPWVRESVWDPDGPALKVDQVIKGVLKLCRQQRCSVIEVRDLAKSLSEDLGVSQKEVKGWIDAQPFTAEDVEAFRQLVVRGQAEEGHVGGLVETLQKARPHFKPTWMAGVLTGLHEGRPHGEI